MSESPGWFRAMRTQDALELMARSKDAFCLSWLIAYRARWSDRFNRHDLALGEALIGDFGACGMTERRYRTAKDNLSKWGFATFRATTRGTVARLTNTSLFDALTFQSDGQDDERPTDDRRATDGRPTTNEQENKVTREQGVVVESAKPNRPPRPKKPALALDDEAWLATLEADPTYQGISIRTELGKMRRWCETKNRKPSRPRFINWLNRIERPMQAGALTQPGLDYTKGF
jgi:hypothetical protein